MNNKSETCLNKKAYQEDVYRSLNHRMCYSSQPPNVSTRGGPQVNKFDIGLQSGPPDVTSRRGGARALYGGAAV